MFSIFPNARLRPSPFHESVMAEGITSASIYNRMILPTSFGDPEAEYWRLIEGVSQWDVAVERQVQLKGPDAAELAQILSPRDISKCKVGQGKYIPLCNHHGVLINDPVLLKHADDCFWFSIADSDIWSWARAIAEERKLNVEISEPDASPMAIQGPKAEDVVASVMGSWVRDLKYFWFKEAEIEGIPVIVQRSGWSKQGGFEIYLLDNTKGTQLWKIFKEAGKVYDIGPGAPATAERTESGLVSYGGDTDRYTNPFEVRLGYYVDLDVGDDVIGIQALRKIMKEGPKRHQLGLLLGGIKPAPLGFSWEEIHRDGKMIGHMTNCVWSPRLKQNIGYALISVDVKADERVEVMRPTGAFAGDLCELPFL